MAKTPDQLANEILKEQLVKEGMNPKTPVNTPSHSVWVQTNDGWKLHSGRDGSEGFNRFAFMPKYKNAMLTKNGQSPEERIKEMDDYELFDSIYYPAWKMGRDNYLQGEEEGLWNELSKYFDLPPYKPASSKNPNVTHIFSVNPKTRTVNLMQRGVSDGRGFGGWAIEPKDLGPLKRRM